LEVQSCAGHSIAYPADGGIVSEGTVLTPRTNHERSLGGATARCYNNLNNLHNLSNAHTAKGTYLDVNGKRPSAKQTRLYATAYDSIYKPTNGGKEEGVAECGVRSIAEHGGVLPCMECPASESAVSYLPIRSTRLVCAE
jgi:hypothetical protein